MKTACGPFFLVCHFVLVFSALLRVPTAQPHNSLRSPNRLVRQAAAPTLRPLKHKRVSRSLKVFDNAGPGWGLRGSADLASEASYEADRVGSNPVRQTTANTQNQITTGSGSSRMPNRS
jgi:hypothetical protein